MTATVNVEIETKDDFSTNRWTKDGERGLADRIYVDAPDGTKIGYYDLVKNRWMLDKTNTTVGMGVVPDASNREQISLRTSSLLTERLRT